MPCGESVPGRPRGAGRGRGADALERFDLIDGFFSDYIARSAPAAPANTASEWSRFAGPALFEEHGQLGAGPPEPGPAVPGLGMDRTAWTVRTGYKCRLPPARLTRYPTGPQNGRSHDFIPGAARRIRRRVAVGGVDLRRFEPLRDFHVKRRGCEILRGLFRAARLGTAC